MDISPLIIAWQTHAYVLFVALAILLLVGLLKQGWFTAWVANVVPKTWLPALSLLLGLVIVWAMDVQGGQTWQQALLDALTKGIASGALAVVGHQVFVEGIRGGREFFPMTRALFQKCFGAKGDPTSLPPTS